MLSQPRVSSAEKLLEAAEMAKVRLDAFTQNLADMYSGKAVKVPCKTLEKIKEKMTGRAVKKHAYEIFDVARSTVLFINPDKFNLARTHLKNMYRDPDKDTIHYDNGKVEVVRIKDRYAKGGGAQPGYSDMQYVVKFPIAPPYKAHLAELQMNLASVAHAKHHIHALYEITRVNCSGILDSHKYQKLQTKIMRLTSFLTEQRFWTAAGPWKNGAQAKLRFDKILRTLQKPMAPGTSSWSFKVHNSDCCFCNILQELAYPHAYKRKMAEQRVRKIIEIHGEKRAMWVPVLSSEELQNAEDLLFEMATKEAEKGGDPMYSPGCAVNIDQWVKSAKARVYLKKKRPKK